MAASGRTGTISQDLENTISSNSAMRIAATKTTTTYQVLGSEELRKTAQIARSQKSWRANCPVLCRDS
jgi:hypothetical protein